MLLPKALEPYRLQILTAPFFLASIAIALSLNVTRDKTEFILISVFYVIGDILTVHYITTKNELSMRISVILAALIFFSVFLYTYFTYGEAQYMFVQPLFLIAALKRLLQDTKMYPTFLNDKCMTIVNLVILVVAGITFLYDEMTATAVHYVQLIGLCLFGFFLAVGDDTEVFTKETIHLVGTIGVSIFTLFCLGDVWYKWNTTGTFIATPFVAFFASLPVALVSGHAYMKTFKKKAKPGI